MKEWREEKIGKLFLIGICVALAILYFIPMKLNMFTFHLMHNNIFHLIVNMMAITTVLYRCKMYMLPIAVIVTSLVWMLITNVVGFSGIIFFMLGSRFPYDLHNSSDPRKYIKWIIIPFIVSALIPQLSFGLHFIPFIIGAGLGTLDYLYTRYIVMNKI